MKEITPIRTVTVKGILYARVEDVAEMIRDMAGAEETDVRRRWTELAYNLEHGK